MADSTETYVHEIQSLLQDEKESVSVTRLATRFRISRTEASRFLFQVLTSSTEQPPKEEDRPQQLQATYVTASTQTIHNASTDANNEASCPQEGDSDIPCTVFTMKSLCIQDKHEEKMPETGKDFLYALSPVEVDDNEDTENCTDLTSTIPTSLVAMQEQTMSVWRDMIKDRDTVQLQECVTSAQDLIRTAESPEEWQARWVKYQKPSTDLGSKSISRNGSSSSGGVGKNSRNPATKAVTAASFFGSSSQQNSKNTKSNNNDKVTAKSSSFTSKGNKKNDKKPTASSFFGKNNSSATSSSKKRAIPQEKENKKQEPNKPSITGNKSVPKEEVGNADDFVGDADDDDDDSAEEEPVEVVKPMEPPKSKKRRSDPPQEEHNHIHDKDTSLPKSEAAGEHRDDDNDVNMDVDETNEESETTEKQQNEPPQPRQRARRKKLVPKTTMDANGYLHTEMVSVWEEIPSDEDEEQQEQQNTRKQTSQPASTKSARAPSATATKSAKAAPLPPPPQQAKKKKTAHSSKGSKMKQGSLTSFFKK